MIASVYTAKSNMTKKVGNLLLDLLLNLKLKTMKTKITQIDIMKANRKGSREAALEFSPGFVSTHKVHKSKKTYSRKNARIEL